MQPHIDRAQIGSALHREMIALRHRILREPLGLAFTAAQLAAEVDQVHLALQHDDVVVGTLLLVPPDAGGTPRISGIMYHPPPRRPSAARAVPLKSGHGIRTRHHRLAA